MITFNCPSTGSKYQVRLIDARTRTYETWIRDVHGATALNCTLGTIDRDARFTAIERVTIGDLIRKLESAG